MNRLLSSAVIIGAVLGAILIASAPAFAQQGLPAGRWVHPDGGVAHGGRQGGRSGGLGAPANSTAPRVAAAAPAQSAGFGVARTPAPAPVGGVTDPSFAGRLGATVGLHALPPVAMPPGIGNINHPGMQPLPAGPQPLPTGLPFPIPNINFPGGTPGMQDSSHNGPGGHWRGPFRGRSGIGAAYSGPIIYYSVPYYIPVYTEIITGTPASPPPPPYQGPYDIVVPPPTQSPQPQQPTAAPPAARPVTLLAFKDHTILIVTDYWLEGDMLVYETSPGVRTPVPLERLDLVLTQQLNRERNVRFVLEARP